MYRGILLYEQELNYYLNEKLWVVRENRRTPIMRMTLLYDPTCPPIGSYRRSSIFLVISVFVALYKR